MSAMAPEQYLEQNVCPFFYCVAQKTHDHTDTDTVILNQELVIKNQSIGVASSAQGFQGVDGIIGWVPYQTSYLLTWRQTNYSVGPVDLTQGTVSNTDQVPTVTDNLYSQGTISSASLGIFYEPSSITDVANGELTFGGTDSTK